MKIQKEEVIEKEEIAQEEAVAEPIQAVEEPIVDEKETSRKLEIENAKLKGIVEGIEKANKPVSRETPQDNWKAVALSDINVLNDEEFETKYKHSKIQATTAIIQYDDQKRDLSTNQKFAKIEAENKLLRKYPDLDEHSREIQEAIDDASPEVKQDPERLSKVIERAYLASKPTQPKGEKVERKQIQSNFEKPTQRAIAPKVENDEIPVEFREVNRKFGITSEKERKALMESDDVPTEFGNGIIFRNSEKGFEKIA